jgi:hypothetical protein
MRNEFAAVVERDKRWYLAYCPEIPGADRRREGLRGIPAIAIREKVVVG